MGLPRDPRSPLLGAVATVHAVAGTLGAMWTYVWGVWPVHESLAPHLAPAEWTRMAWAGFAGGALQALALGAALYVPTLLVGRWRPEVTPRFAAACAAGAALTVLAGAAIAAVQFAHTHPRF
jgi:hypothetical protein